MAQNDSRLDVLKKNLSPWIKKFGQSDLFLLLLCGVAQMFVLIYTGFNPLTDFLGNEDAIWEHLPYYLHSYHRMLEEYWPHILGGAVGQSIFGMPFLYFLYTGGLLNIGNYFLLLHWLAMSAIPFYAIKIIELLTPPYNMLDLSPSPDAAPRLKSCLIDRPRNVAYTALLSIFFAAMPVMILRINVGHATHVIGFCIFFLLVALFLAAIRQRLSITLFVFSLIMLLQIFPYYDYQQIHHSLVYAWPLMIVLLGFYPRDLWHLLGPKYGRKIWRLNLPNLFLITGAFGVCFYFFYGMYASFTWDDISRNLSEKPITFSYLQTFWKDLWSSLFFSSKITAYPHQIDHLHETNQPFGPFFWVTIILIFIPRAKMPTIFSPRLLAVLLNGWLLFFILVSLQIAPFANWFTHYVPFAAAFRIPERVFFLAVYVIQIIAILVGQNLVWTKSPPSLTVTGDLSNPLTSVSRRTYLVLVLLGLIASLEIINSAYLEYGIYLILLGWGCWNLPAICPKSWGRLHTVLKAVLKKIQTVLKIPAIAHYPSLVFYIILIFNTALALQGFRERIQMRSFVSWEFLNQVFRSGHHLYQALPELENLERLVYDFSLQRFSNYGQLIRIPSLDGYSVAQRRFSQLFFASQRLPYHPVQYAYNFHTITRGFWLFKHLYAINFKIFSLNAERPLEITPLVRTPGYWFPHKNFQLIESYDALIKEGLSHIAAHSFFDTLFILKADQSLYEQALNTTNKLPALRPPNNHELASQTIFQVEILPEIRPQTKPIPLVVALNYAKILTAIGHKINEAGEMQQIVLPTFAADGPLLGIMLSSNTDWQKIEVKAVHPWVTWGKFIILWGIISLGIAFYLFGRRRHGPT